MEQNEQAITLTQLKLRSGFGRTKIRKFIKLGLIPFHKNGAHYRFYFSEVMPILKGLSK